MIEKRTWDDTSKPMPRRTSDCDDTVSTVWFNRLVQWARRRATGGVGEGGASPTVKADRIALDAASAASSLRAWTMARGRFRSPTGAPRPAMSDSPTDG